MKRFIVFTLCFFITEYAELFLSNAAQTTDKRRISLVIGNSAYKSAPLINPVNDAQDITNTLRQLEFEVMHKVNADQRTIEDAIFEFSKSLKKGGVGLFYYYAGHGIQVNGRNYLIPIRANIKAERDIKYKAVDLGQVMDGMYDAGNGLNIVLLDACRDNPFVRSFRTNRLGLARMDAPTGTFIAYATAPNSIAADGPGRNGIFTHHLLKNMTVPGLKIEDILKKVRNGVMEQTGNKQVPWQASSLTGDFYFASSSTPISPSSTQLADEWAKLERERQELERLKLEIEKEKLAAERERLKAEKQEIQRAKLPVHKKPAPIVAAIKPKVREVGRDGHYIAYANGVVYDSKTGLEWVVGPDKNTTWWQARRWLRRLTIAGAGWRMPPREELKSLYQKGKGKRNMTPLLKTTGWWVWSGEGFGGRESAWDFYFGTNARLGAYALDSIFLRVFAVRSRR